MAPPPPRVAQVLLDAGMATRLSPRDRTCMAGLFTAFAAMDGERVAVRAAGPPPTHTHLHPTPPHPTTTTTTHTRARPTLVAGLGPGLQR